MVRSLSTGHNTKISIKHTSNRRKRQQHADKIGDFRPTQEEAGHKSNINISKKKKRAITAGRRRRRHLEGYLINRIRTLRIPAMEVRITKKTTILRRSLKLHSLMRTSQLKPQAKTSGCSPTFITCSKTKM